MSLTNIKRRLFFLVMAGLLLSFSTSVGAEKELFALNEPKNSLAQNSPGKILPAQNALPIEAGGSGHIDEKAAFAVREENTTREIDCLVWPEKFWVFLFGVYLFLLVFNLSFGLKDKKKIQWFWELLITLLALWTWKELDACEMQRWFYYCVLESGLIIYFFYTYSFLASREK